MIPDYEVTVVAVTVFRKSLIGFDTLMFQPLQREHYLIPSPIHELFDVSLFHTHPSTLLPK